MRTIFLCGHESPYGYAHLEPILDSGFEIVAVVVATDARWQRFRATLNGTRYFDPRPSPSLERRLKTAVKRALPASVLAAMGRADADELATIRKIAKQRRVLLLQTDNANLPGFRAQLEALQPDLFLSAAYPQIFKASLLEIPGNGCVNFHPSLLPHFRGAHPHFWALATGAETSGVSAHFMTPKIDEGDVLASIEFSIEEYGYTGLYDRIVRETPRLVDKVEAFFRDPASRAVPQDASKVTKFMNDREIHHRVFWTLHSAEEIVNLSRTEQAFCFFRNARIRILGVTADETNRNLTNDVRVEPGTIVDLHKDGLVVKTRDACVYIPELVDEANRWTSADWIRERLPVVGEKMQ